MNFIEAVNEMKQGKKMCCSQYCMWNYIYFKDGSIINSNGRTVSLDISSVDDIHGDYWDLYAEEGYYISIEEDEFYLYTGDKWYYWDEDDWEEGSSHYYMATQIYKDKIILREPGFFDIALCKIDTKPTFIQFEEDWRETEAVVEAPLDRN